MADLNRVISRLTDLLGSPAAKRAERVADELPEVRKQFSDKALLEALISGNPVMGIEPKKFEDLAAPLGRTDPTYMSSPQFRNKTGSILRALNDLQIDPQAKGVGISEVPVLIMHPGSGRVMHHDGRHRMRTLAGVYPKDRSMLEILPADRNAHPVDQELNDVFGYAPPVQGIFGRFARTSRANQEAYQEKLDKLLEQLHADRAVTPESWYYDHRGQYVPTNRRPDVRLGDYGEPFDTGGFVDADQNNEASSSVTDVAGRTYFPITQENARNAGFMTEHQFFDPFRFVAPVPASQGTGSGTGTIDPSLVQPGDLTNQSPQITGFWGSGEGGASQGQDSGPAVGGNASTASNSSSQGDPVAEAVNAVANAVAAAVDSNIGVGPTGPTSGGQGNAESTASGPGPSNAPGGAPGTDDGVGSGTGETYARGGRVAKDWVESLMYGVPMAQGGFMGKALDMGNQMLSPPQLEQLGDQVGTALEDRMRRLNETMELDREAVAAPNDPLRGKLDNMRQLQGMAPITDQAWQGYQTQGGSPADLLQGLPQFQSGGKVAKEIGRRAMFGRGKVTDATQEPRPFRRATGTRAAFTGAVY